MAECLITTGGTSGDLRIDFKVGGDPNVLFTSYGDVIYIPDAATDVTYTRLSGDVTAASGCVTITALPKLYYKFTYDRPIPSDIDYVPVFNAIILGVTAVAIEATSDEYSHWPLLVSNIKALGDSTIDVTAFKITDNSVTNSTVNLIMSIIGTDVPELRILSPYGSLSYLKGVTSATAVPAGYTAITYSIPTPAP